MGGETPVMIDVCDGRVRGALLYARVKRRPSAARRSRFGVRSGGPPKAPTRSLRNVSIVIRRTLQPAHTADRIGRGPLSRRQAIHVRATPLMTTTMIRVTIALLRMCAYHGVGTAAKLRLRPPSIERQSCD